jgi:hypothetical protein
MDKKEYLFKTLSRTNRKDKENYVVNRVYNRLNDLEIQPVTQQYAQRPNQKFALIDLYFPQFNLAIECDEEKHKHTIGEDQIRTVDISHMMMEDIIGAVQTEFDEKRVSIYDKTIEEINTQIDEIVDFIKNKKIEMGNQFKPWGELSDDAASAIENGMIAVDDNYFFRLNSDYRKLFGREGVAQHSYYPINDEYALWGPMLYKMNQDLDNLKVDWINILSQDWEELYEYDCNKNPRPGEERHKRITFAKTKNALGFRGYRFIGVYKKTNRIKVIKNRTFMVYERVAEEISLNPFLNQE